MLTTILAFLAPAVGLLAPLLPESFLGQFFTQATKHCRCFPGDACWPSIAEWQEFNQTVDGKLIATVPIASVCHDDFGDYDPEKCDALRNVWYFPETHLSHPSSPMAPWFTNNSCNPFSDRAEPCSIDGLIQYAVNATDSLDFQKTIAFTKSKNIRLVIRNTGHDYNGKSTGPGAVALWTRHLKSIELLDYQSPGYTGKAVKMGAGVEGGEAFSFADSHNLLVVGGNCPTVGIAGGYTQGGGHGRLSKYGLAADQVLEWEIITAGGELVIASPEQNSDLYWALSGGGGSTFGVVVSMTVKTYPTTKVSTATLMVGKTEENEEQFWEVVNTFQASLPAAVDQGVQVIFVVVPNAFLITPATAPGLSQAELDSLLKPTLDKLDSFSIPYQYASAEHPSFLTSYTSTGGSWNVSDFSLGGRLISRNVVEHKNQAFTNALRNITANGALLSGIGLSVPRDPDAIGVNPFWRNTLVSVAFGMPFDFDNWGLNAERHRIIAEELMPQLAALDTESGSYLSEADFREPNWKQLFYGNHYERLDDIKRKWDPEDQFYALQAVGSDRWSEKPDGRLCKV